MASDRINLLVLEGDGIGPEITRASVDVLRHVDAIHKLGLHFTSGDIGFTSLKEAGTTFPKSVLEAARGADGIVLGPVSHNAYPPAAEGGLNPSGELRKNLDLFANIRPSRTRDGVEAPSRKPFDLVVVRENTEGFYADRSMFMGPGEVMPTPDVALAIRKITRHASLRIAREGFDLAMTRRRKVCVVHKANVLRLSDGLFLEATREIAKDYPDVEVEEQLVDAMAALLVRDASRYDVIVTTNMYGDILSDEAAELAGGLGLGASLNAGEHHGMAQAAHGSAPTLAGKDIANPFSLIASAAMLLIWLS
ncbi:MAG: isocitrate/isopropylmalate dehydrogenase family protein, partial [Hyphomicrobiales bacterium]|nr:isocitrate/isopropylmalate dehydrogenase family protein [Hyphomicrobiales bacterium]